MLDKIQPEVKHTLEKFSKAIGIDPITILENCFVRWIAENDAKVKVYGKHPALLMEFSTNADGFTMRGWPLYDLLLKNFIKVNEAEKETRLYESMALKRPINIEDIEWLKRRVFQEEKVKEGVCQMCGVNAVLIPSDDESSICEACAEKMMK